METLAAKSPENITVKHFQGESHFYLGTYLQAAGHTTDALQAYRLARDIFDSVSQADPKDVFSKHFIGFSYERIGTVFVGQGQVMQGLDYLRKAVAVFSSLPPEESKNMLALSGLADTYEGFRAAYEAQGHWRDALSYYERSLEIWGRMRQHQGVLYPVDGGKPARLNAAIDRCRNHVAASRPGSRASAANPK